MTDEYWAQKRRKSNDTVHLYDTGRVALCAGPPLNQPTKNSEEVEYRIDENELENNEYLVRDEEIIGKICGNCRKIALGTLFE